MTHQDRNTRSYIRENVIVFKKTNEKFGGLSNMSTAYPLTLNGREIRTSEALYQACRFPNHPDVQEMIFEQKSPMTAKMKSKPHRKNTRDDWISVRVNIMRWCLRVKLACNWLDFGELLLSTENKSIVEESSKDSFWGAKSQDNQLEGQNVLGRLLMELREELKTKPSALEIVPPLQINNFMILGEKVKTVYADKLKHSPKQIGIPGLDY